MLKLLARITQKEQEALIKKAKGQPLTVEEEVDAEVGLFEVSTAWNKDIHWTKRYIASSLMILLSVLIDFSVISADEKHIRSRVSQSRRIESL